MSNNESPFVLPKNGGHCTVLSTEKHSKRIPLRHTVFEENLLPDVIHKIKNGLGGIGGFAALLERDLGEADARTRLVQRIQDGVCRVDEVVISLMLLVKNVVPRPKKIQLSSFITEVCGSAWRNDKKSMPEIVICPNFPDGRVELHADPQIVREILLRTIQFVDSVKGKMDAITVRPQPRRKIGLEFSFRNGNLPRSLPEKTLQLVERCESVEARLALAIVVRMVDLHGGKVFIVSRTRKQKVLTIHLAKGN